MNQCWPRSPTSYGVTRQQWVNIKGFQPLHATAMLENTNFFSFNREMMASRKTEMHTRFVLGKWIPELKKTTPTRAKWIKPWEALNNVIDEKQGKSEGFDSCDRPSNLAQIWSKSSIFQPVWLWNVMYDLQNNRAPLLYYINLCVSFQIHRWIQTEFTLRKRSIRVEIGDFLSLVTLKFDGWPWKTIGHLFYTT